MAAPESTRDRDWWRDAVIYQIYPRSFASSGAPVGDLAAITARLDHLVTVGADALWLSPCYVSPQRDGGYDVADYRDIDPLFGDLADMDALIAEAHRLGLRVIVDLVPNHTSDQHEWFRAALAAGPGSPERERYWFREGHGAQPPNDWRSVFGAGAWTRVRDRPDAPGSAWAEDESWYLHLFDTSQPDLNWDHPEVLEEFDDILRFWLTRGVDGFRVDVAHGLAKDPELPDWANRAEMAGHGDRAQAPMWDRDEVHEIYRRWHRVLAEFGPDRILVAEAWVDPPARLACYVRPDEMHQAFNFDFLSCPWHAEDLHRVISDTLSANDAVGAPTTWVLSNHDVVRHASRLGLEVTGKGPNGIRPGEPQPDVELGARRARAATALMLALPGSAYLYQGEELGLPEHLDLPDEVRQDPAFFRTGGEEAGRDGCRVPLPWVADAPAFGFSPTGESWLPQPAEWADLAVDRQLDDPGSSLAMYRDLIRRRRELGLGRGTWQWLDTPDGVLAGVNRGEGRADLLVVCTVEASWPVPDGWRVLLATDQVGVDGLVPTGTTVWATTSR
ncbi:MAG: glycoside hydrolase family 13 protein [Propionibacterium sp.]|nr:glycoside hydrolase family 13 protein [Propionibacterium sp.]